MQDPIKFIPNKIISDVILDPKYQKLKNTYEKLSNFINYSEINVIANKNIKQINNLKKNLIEFIISDDSNKVNIENIKLI